MIILLFAYFQSLIYIFIIITNFITLIMINFINWFLILLFNGNSKNLILLILLMLFVIKIMLTF